MYSSVMGPWYYFTADDGQIDLEKQDYLGIGTLESYVKLKDYFGEQALVPLYVEVDDGLRLSRALERERGQKEPKYAEMCRRFLADCEDFSEEKYSKSRNCTPIFRIIQRQKPVFPKFRILWNNRKRYDIMSVSERNVLAHSANGDHDSCESSVKHRRCES